MGNLSHPASINGLRGKGYAEIVEEGNRMRCRGRFVFDDWGKGMELAISDEPKFYEGVVYEKGKVHNLRFKVILDSTHVGSEPGGHILFSNAGNPFSETV